MVSKEEPALTTPRRNPPPWERKAPALQAGDEAAAELFFSWVIPGRLAGARAPMTDRDLKVLSDLGISLLVRLTEASFVTNEQVQQAGLEDLHDPVPDFGAPTLEQMSRIVDRVQATMISGRAAVISCFAGHGRTGTMLSCCLVAQGLSTEAAFRFMELIRRPHSETEEQREAVRRFERASTRA
jgi:atypical dual specificity phosphatase